MHPVAAVIPLESPPEAPVPFRLGYRRWLDGLRGVAILLVLAFHFRLLPGGSLGVDIFFVLSGFLITNLLVDEWQRRGAISLKLFYFRRALRLLPAFAALLVLFVIGTLLFQREETWPERWHELAVAGLYIANWPTLHGASMSMLGHTWSLSLEEQFYLLWPALLYGLFRLGLSRNRIMQIVIGGIFASAMLRLVLHNQHRLLGPASRVDIIRMYTGLDTRADSLLMGCLAALLVTAGLIPTARRFVQGLKIASVLSVIGLGFCISRRDLGSSQYYDGLFTLVALMTSVVIVRLLTAPTGWLAWLLQSAPLVGAGRISYGLYLFHIPVIAWLAAEDLGPRNLVNVGLLTGVTFAVSLASYYAIECPFLRLKDRMHSPARVKPVVLAEMPRQSAA